MFTNFLEVLRSLGTNICLHVVYTVTHSANSMTRPCTPMGYILEECYIWQNWKKKKKESCKIKSVHKFLNWKKSESFLACLPLIILQVRKLHPTNKRVIFLRSVMARLGLKVRSSEFQFTVLLVTPYRLIEPKTLCRYLSITFWCPIPMPLHPISTHTLPSFYLGLRTTHAAVHCCVEHLLKAQAQTHLQEIARLNVSEMPGGYIWLLMLWEARVVFFWNGLMMTTSFYWSGIIFPEGLAAGGMWNMKGLLHFVYLFT